MPLTPRQREILDAFVRLTDEDGGIPPTVRALGEAVGLTSSSTIQQHLQGLARKGYLEHRGDYKSPAFRLAKREVA